MHNGALTQKERLAYFDEEEAARVRVVLTDDVDFQAKGREIADKPAKERHGAAEKEARNYAPYRTAAWQSTVDLLLVVAEEPWLMRGTTRRDFIANLGRAGVWADSPLDELDGRRVRERWGKLDEGAQALAHFGSGKCLNFLKCGKHLHGRYGRGAWKRRSRRTHCDECKGKLTLGLLDSQVDAKRQALDVLTGRRRRQRARRRST